MKWKDRSGDIHVGPIKRERVDGRDRVTAIVNGEPIFIESADAELAPSTEAFASAFLIPALERRGRLALDQPLSATWLANAEKLVALFRSWWGYAGPDPLETLQSRPDAGPPRVEGGQCFSGGMDSFYTLFRSPHRRDLLVFIHGLDIPLSDQRRMDGYEPSLRAVAAATGREALILRTSLRRHSLIRAVSWIRMHGAALAAAGHVLIGTIGTLVIPASWSYAWREPHGSHWDSDPLWSSDQLRVVHDDPSLERWEKLPQIADEPLLYQHLRVCWENLEPEGNCGRCEKCMRTRVLFARWGLIDRIEPLFKEKRSLIESLDRMEPLSEEPLKKIWAAYYINWPLPADVHSAIERLVDRSRREATPGLWLRIRLRLRNLGRKVRRIGRRRYR